MRLEELEDIIKKIREEGATDDTSIRFLKNYKLVELSYNPEKNQISCIFQCVGTEQLWG